MSALGSGLGMGLKAVGGIFGGLAASRAMKRVKKNIERQRQTNRNWYDRRYNEDATQRADAQAVLTQTMASIRDRNRQAAGTQAVMGGTDESVAAAKAANNEALARTMTNIAVNGEARKDAIEGQYMQTDMDLQRQLNNIDLKRGVEIGKAVGGVSDAAAGIIGGDSSIDTKDGSNG